MRKLLIIGISTMLLITGCWDKVEIDKRIFVTELGLDKFVGEEISPREEEMFEDIVPDMYLIVFGFPNTGIIAGKDNGEPRFRVASTGKNIYNVINNLTTRMERDFNFDHTKLIVLGESLAKDEKLMRQVLDAIERSPNIGRRINLMITPGTAREALNTEVPEQPIIGLYIRDLMAKPTRMARAPDADLGYILRTLHESKATLAPRLTYSKNGIKVSGAAVFKEYKLVGWLGELETKALMFMLDKVEWAEKNIIVRGLNLAIAITDSDTKMEINEKDGKLTASFDIKAEGDIRQHAFQVIGQTFDEKYLEEVEKEVKKMISERIIITFKKIQEEYGADLIQAGEYLRKHNPKLWDEVKENWDEVFAHMDIEVNVRIKIRRVGVVK